MSEAYDQKNAEAYEANTTLIIDAIDRIQRDDSLKVTISQIVKLTGLHRNTISDRGWPKDRLDEVREQRSKAKERQKKAENGQNPVRVLEGKLENAFRELVYWFRRYQEIDDKHEQLLANFMRMTDAKNMYEEKYLAEKKRSVELQKQIDNLPNY